MALSTRKKSVLNNLIKYIAALRKGQFSPSDGGDVRLGDLLGSHRIIAASSVSIDASPKAVTINGLLASDIAIAVIDSDESGIGAVSQVCMGAVCTANTLTITSGAVPAGAVSAVAKYLVLRAQN